MATNVGVILYFSVIKTIKNQLIPVLLLLYITDLTSSVKSLEESSTIEAALFNAERVLSTEPTIFHYPRSSALVGRIASKRRAREEEDDVAEEEEVVVVAGAGAASAVAVDDWQMETKPVPTSSSLVESTPEKPPPLVVKHISHRDVGGIPYPSSSPRYPPQIPSYAPPSRSGFITPPLPPEYSNPFAGKPTLRGSNSESNNHSARRPIPPPPLFRTAYENKDRVPLPPPDFMVPETKPSGKKALNTPSRPNSHHTLDSAFKETVNSNNNSNNNNNNSNNNKESPTVRQTNDTDFDFVPMLQYPSVSRILSGSSGRKHDIPDFGDRHSGPNSRHGHHNYDHMAKNMPKLRKEQQQQTPGSGVPREAATPKPPEIYRGGAGPGKAEPSQNATTNATEDKATGPRIGVSGEETETTNAGEAPAAEDADTEEEEEEERRAEEETAADGNREVDSELHDSESHKVNDKNALYLWVVAWDIHVYLIASLFTLLSIYAVYNLVLMRFYKHLLSRPYYISIHVIIALIGVLRSVYLFHDAYNVAHSYPEPISHLLLNITCPLITTTFAIMFLYLIKTTDVLLFNSSMLKHPLCFILISLSHLALCVCLDVTSDLTFDVSGTKYLPLVCQCIYILFCVILGGSYLYIYKTLASAATRKQVEMFGSLYTTTSDLQKNRPAALSLSIRITLAVSMLILLMAVVQIYGIFGVPVGLHDSYSFLEPQNHTMQRWIWWAYHFSVRVIEVSICYLLTWAAMQRLQNEVDEKETNSQNSTTGFALFPCGPCRNADENIDDIYPAVCNTNQAIHNYSLRTGKKVYDDSFPLNNMGGEVTGTGQAPPPPMDKYPEASDPYDRRKAKRHNGTLPWHLNQSTQSNNYDEIGPGSEVIEIKDALTRKGLSTLNRSDSDASHGSHLPAHVSYESIGYHSGTFQPRLGVDNGHFDRDRDSNSEHGSSLSKADSHCGGDSDPCDGGPGRGGGGSFTTGHKRGHRGSHAVRKSGTLTSFPGGERRRMPAGRDGAQTLREGGRERQSPNSMLVDENGFVRFRSLADAERVSDESARRSGHGKKSLPRRCVNEVAR